MDWRLLEYAKEAEETASGLHTFLAEIPQYSRDITGDIAELFAISSGLHVLHEELDLSRYGRSSGRILRDLEVCLPSLGYTLDTVRNMFSKSKNRRQAPGAFPGTPPYAQIWEDSLADMKAQGIGLPGRLEMYRTYLQGMQDILKRYMPLKLEKTRLTTGSNHADEDIDLIRNRLSRLLKRQEPVEDYFTRLGVSHGKSCICRTLIHSWHWLLRQIHVPEHKRPFNARCCSSDRRRFRFTQRLSTSIYYLRFRRITYVNYAIGVKYR